MRKERREALKGGIIARESKAGAGYKLRPAKSDKRLPTAKVRNAEADAQKKAHRKT